VTRVTIERLGHQGDGIAPGPVYVPRVLPREVVEGAVENGRINDPRIVTPSPDRIRPPCSHYRACGGCSLQHASDEFVEQWKLDVVRNALSAHGIETVFRPIATSPPNSRRRAVLSARRSNAGASVGFHGARSDVITEINGCLLLHPDLMHTLPAIADLTRAGGSRKGELSATVTRSQTGPDISIAGGKTPDPETETELAGIAKKWNLARLTWNGETIAARAQPAQAFGKALVVPPPGAFLQSTLEGEAALVAAVAEAVGSYRRLADLFSGAGTFTLPLAEWAEVHAVEADASMLEALDAGWRHAAGLKRVTTEVRDLYRRPLLPDELNKFKAVVIDPPRAGAEAQIHEIGRSALKRVAMVSCNPVSFARDSGILVEAGFSLDWVQVVDQFRWSTHVEMAAQLSRH
jgi:23S rRNA (uracil1939-C5)-methyltransferase